MTWLLRKWASLCNKARILRWRLVYPRLTVGEGTVIQSGVRIRLYPKGSIRFGKFCSIERNATLEGGGDIVIGDNGFVGEGTIISALRSVRIGSDALIASGCVIRDADHGTFDTPYRLQPMVQSSVQIGDNVWLGANVVVLKGVAVGDNCIVGAGAVVTKSLPANARAVGVPARARD